MLSQTLHRLRSERTIGIWASESRSTALLCLATELPAAILARMLGINIKAAIVWQQAASGDWTSYAAEISRRTTQSGRHSDDSDT